MPTPPQQVPFEAKKTVILFKTPYPTLPYPTLPHPILSYPCDLILSVTFQSLAIGEAWNTDWETESLLTTMVQNNTSTLPFFVAAVTTSS